MTNKTIPDHTAVRVALWRALHLELDSKPFVFEDKVGFDLVAPEDNWRDRGDMHPVGTKGYRASIVGRARFIEDLLEEKIKTGIEQYVIVGAGLDSYAQRKLQHNTSLNVFEIEEPKTQKWKIKRLKDLGFAHLQNHHFIPVDFETGEDWPMKLLHSSFNFDRPAFVSSTGVTMYLTREANLDKLAKIAKLAHGSTLAMTFMLPTNLVEPQDRAGYEMVMKKAAEAGTPFLGLYTPKEMLELAKIAGFKKVRHISRNEIIERYFKDRSDGLIPSSGEEFLIAET